MRSLVTGGAGFIGSNLVDALLARGDEVTVLDDLSTGRRENLDRGSGGGRAAGRDGRPRRRRGGAGGAARHGRETIFHLAAQIDVRKSVADPAFDAAVNVGGTANVLEAARLGRRRALRLRLHRRGDLRRGGGQGAAAWARVPRSSRCPPTDRASSPPRATWPSIDRLYGLSSVALRLGNVYGPRQDPLGEAGVIAIFCGKLRAGERPTVFGDGTQTRDYIYVGDVVAAALAAAAWTGERPDQHRHRDRDRACWTWSRCWRAWRRRGLRARVRTAPRRRGAADRDRPVPRRGANWGGGAAVGLEEGLRLTLDSL